MGGAQTNLDKAYAFLAAWEHRKPLSNRVFGQVMYVRELGIRAYRELSDWSLICLDSDSCATTKTNFRNGSESKSGRGGHSYGRRNLLSTSRARTAVLLQRQIFVRVGLAPALRKVVILFDDDENAAFLRRLIYQPLERDVVAMPARPVTFLVKDGTNLSDWAAKIIRRPSYLAAVLIASRG
ncbi:hypothetical protein XA68_10784 [Ophiocordyceps unilateralis]|uniref:Uncharacterized protein n=1 Tax=Ophiocordyceps unilateralis TaxID=268505 RepID=A0A2A9PHP2_OPHUN|nr:hypothetical protein XA68_10784 [Ophiocordyceps unilateralis]